MDEKYCPLAQSDRFGVGECVREKCAWWGAGFNNEWGKEGGCALRFLGEYALKNA